MFLDHLKNTNTTVAANAAEHSVSFMDCMEAALYCTEVHSAADAYLIKAEATMMAAASEDGEGAAKEGFWANVKKVFKKMVDAVVALGKKIVAFVNNTIKPKIAKIVKQIAVKWQSVGMKSKLEKYKGATPDVSKLADVTFIDGKEAGNIITKIFKDVAAKFKPSNTHSEENIENFNVEDFAKDLPKMSDKSASYIRSAKDLKYADISNMVKDITSGNSVKDILKVVGDSSKSATTLDSAYIKSAEEMYKQANEEKNETLAKQAMNTIKRARQYATAIGIVSNHAGSCAVSTILSQAKAVNAWFAACAKKESKPEEKK